MSLNKALPYSALDAAAAAEMAGGGWQMADMWTATPPFPGHS